MFCSERLMPIIKPGLVDSWQIRPLLKIKF